MIDDIMSALEYMELKKKVQNDKQLVNRISLKQSEIARRLVPMFIRSNEVDKAHIVQDKQRLLQWGVYPYKAMNGGIKNAFYDLLLRFPGSLVLLRPVLKKFLKR